MLMETIILQRLVELRTFLNVFGQVFQLRLFYFTHQSRVIVFKSLFYNSSPYVYVSTGLEKLL